VVIDEANNRAYVSAALTGFVEVYDTKTLEHIGQLEFVVERGKNLFNSTDLILDSAGGKLYGVSRDTPWVGWIDLKTGKSTTVKVPQAQGATDIARDPQTAVCMSRPRRRTMSWFLMRTVRYLRIPILVPGEYLSSGIR
jgi:DNA-binding beta-propeller fold protein YncE